ncbi:hypothetical protein RRG08_005104 [Elysia crispata]|uniref:Uncharacterized protein n=1 Tax=Elysia crispata TaxID=231223 RepID=A0AAE0YE01_9GAST|nr:hypothetical protein RRG08_005104 [Elysia crispata]
MTHVGSTSWVVFNPIPVHLFRCPNLTYRPVTCVDTPVRLAVRRVGKQASDVTRTVRQNKCCDKQGLPLVRGCLRVPRPQGGIPILFRLEVDNNTAITSGATTHTLISYGWSISAG